MPRLVHISVLVLAFLMPLVAVSAPGRWDILTPEHPLWAEGLEGAVLVLEDGSHALLLLRPTTDDALVSVAYPGVPDQPELMSTLEMPDGGIRRLSLSGDALISLPAPKDGFAAYGFVIDAEDFELLQAGLTWRLTSKTEEIVFPLTGSRVAIQKAIELRAATAAANAIKDE